MQTTHRYCVVLVTVPDRKTARRLATAALTQHLAACVTPPESVEVLAPLPGAAGQGTGDMRIPPTNRAPPRGPDGTSGHSSASPSITMKAGFFLIAASRQPWPSFRLVQAVRPRARRYLTGDGALVLLKRPGLGTGEPAPLGRSPGREPDTARRRSPMQSILLRTPRLQAAHP